MKKINLPKGYENYEIIDYDHVLKPLKGATKSFYLIQRIGTDEIYILDPETINNKHPTMLDYKSDLVKKMRNEKDQKI